MKLPNPNFRVNSLMTMLFGALLYTTVLAQDWEYKDVEEGYESLNLAIEEDTTATGEALSLNRVYRLSRGGTYILNGSIVNIKGAPLRIFAAEGPGPKPLLIMAVDETGASNHPFLPEGDTHLKNLYMSGSNMLGNDNRYFINIYSNGARIVLDGIQVDFADQAHVKTYSKENKIYWYNCEMRNGYLLTDSGRGRFFDARGAAADSLVMINNTFYVNKQKDIRLDGSLAKNIIIDHNTFYLNTGSESGGTGSIEGPLEIGTAINARVTNNIFQDLGMEGQRNAAPVESMPIIQVDTVRSPAFPEATRNWLIKNNAYGWHDDVKAFWASKSDVVRPPEFISSWGMTHYFAGHKPNFVAENNFEEYIQFMDAPTVDACLDYVKYRYESNFSDVGNPDYRADRNGTGTLQDNPETFGPEEDPYNFDYPTTQIAYTAADGGFPLGDLNWFPDKKAEWEQYITGVDDLNDRIAMNYVLEQNYPNPFNPMTEIRYTLPKAARVTVTIYNTLGQEVARLLDNQERAAGNHSLTWKVNEASSGVSSGVYYYRLKADDVQVTKKMMLVR